MYGQCWDTLLVITHRQSHNKYRPQKITTKSHNLTYSLTTIGEKKVRILYILLICSTKKVYFLLKNQSKYFKLHYKKHIKIGI